MRARHGIFAFAHIGDLHLERAEDRHADDLRAILAEVAGLHRSGLLDFAFLPGDLAEDGEAAQYAILRAALDRQPDLPVRLIAGDHDRQHGTMTDFDALFAAVAGSPRGGGHAARRHALPRPRDAASVTQSYYAETIGGVHCLFLDMISAGYGEKGFGLDFRLGPRQLAWLEDALAQAARQGLPCAVFTHTYPDDLCVPHERAALAGLIRHHGVRLVEMGHTHYNELAPDGRTLYAAARSVGQNEDGSVGYAVAAIDGAVTSWRFKPLDRALPFVMITSPADRRLATAPRDAALDGQIDVRALVLTDQPQGAWCCRVRIDGGASCPMVPDGPRTVHAWIPWPEGARRLAVTVTDGTGNADTEVIEPVGRTFVPPPAHERPGSDTCRLPAWPEKGLRGDQLGPNRNGRHW
ncbi:metallophosphoesterase family protein [Methylobacterium longum]|uniref:Metallophosphoesterase n=1 Tax=Methylobacterium longum TaxID=767694 RepID=A0ABT8AKT4_9HYPH|nr:metallophosphoesterase [Methylobacterium longum]MDN3570489.1 metallophosphoesterase [Methylobacterium longum]GJE14045.1 3',5'-cyclic adenosine monophosphate phosphodiesterase CpdA [Methylobacterium longum]